MGFGAALRRSELVGARWAEGVALALLSGLVLGAVVAPPDAVSAIAVAASAMARRYSRSPGVARS